MTITPRYDKQHQVMIFHHMRKSTVSHTTPHAKIVLMFFLSFSNLIFFS